MMTASLAAAALLVMASPASAGPVEHGVTVAAPSGECRSALEKLGTDKAIAEAADAYTASDLQIADLQQNARLYLNGKPRVREYKWQDGACSAKVEVDVNALAVQQKVRTTASCSRPVGVLVRMDRAEELQKRQLATPDWLQARWTKELQDRGLVIIDLLEAEGAFRKLVAENCGGHTGNSAANCSTQELSFGEATFRALENLKFGQDNAADLGTQKLLALKDRGVLLVAEFKADISAQSIMVSATPAAFDIENRDRPWALASTEKSGLRRQRPDEAVLINILAELADEIATETVAQCAKYG